MTMKECNNIWILSELYKLYLDLVWEQDILSKLQCSEI
jgi:hypothetical protein